MTDIPSNILITGAAGGLGSALSLACARAGAQTLLVDKDLKGLETVCDRIESADGLAPAYCQLDLASAGPEACAELVSDFIGAYGQLSGLAHCAAQFDGLQPLDQVPGDVWLRQVQVNLNAAWLLTVSCLASLRHAGDSTVVFVLDDEARSRSAYWGPYGVSKAALRALAATFAEELEGTACRVFGVDPGPMRTPLRAKAFLAESPDTQPTPDEAANHMAELLLGGGGDQAVLHRVQVN